MKIIDSDGDGVVDIINAEIDLQNEDPKCRADVTYIRGTNTQIGKADPEECYYTISGSSWKSSQSLYDSVCIRGEPLEETKTEFGSRLPLGVYNYASCHTD